MAEIDLSIIIISFNTASITKKCLDTVCASLQTSRLKWEVVIVDNASNDDSPKMLAAYQKTHPDHIRYVANSRNLGFGRANNQAVADSRGRYILLLNSDTEILDNAIVKMYEYYVKNERTVQFMGCKLLNADHSPQPSAAPFFSLPVVFGFLFLKGDKIGLTRSSPSSVKQVGWVSGACIFTKKKYYVELGGFDEGIFMYMEEVDLLYRAKKKGYVTVFYPGAQIIHIGSASSNKTYPILQAYRGFIYFYKKHYSPLALFILRGMLKLKAFVALTIGTILRRPYLIETYAEAYKVAQVD
ncbi:glycosyltransferase family 2 protein [Candidatus Microgenomates bacterium]|nr:glycosyltransferase family 2 protein [Candidatus Microgenomates bacterium]